MNDEVQLQPFPKLSRNDLPFPLVMGRSLSNLEFARHAVAQCYLEGKIKPVFLELSEVITDNLTQMTALRDRVVAGLSDSQIIIDLVLQAKVRLDKVHPDCEWRELITD